MNITVDTKLIGLIGMPLGQSFSSYFQNETFKKLEMDYIYYPIEVEETHLKDVVNGMRYMNFAGFGVTKPYKVEILRYLDEIDTLAQKMGSVNTVVITEGRLKGYNTDGQGCTKSLNIDAKVDTSNSVFASFGAGGTARAVCFDLAYKGAKKIYVISKSESAKKLAHELNDEFGEIAFGCKISEIDKISEIMQEAEVIMNFTGIGMGDTIGQSFIDPKLIKSTHLCFDATYNPSETAFLKDAISMGAKTINGLNMLVNQGALQFKLWTKEDEPYKVMRDIIAKIAK